MSFKNCLLIVVLYLTSGLFSLFSQLPTHPFSLVWLPSGVSFVCLLIFGYRYWPVIFWASFLTYMVMFAGILHSSVFLVLAAPAISMAIAATLKAILGVYGTRFFLKTLSLEQVKDILIFLFIGGPLSCMLGSIVEVLLLVLAHVVSPDAILSVWLNLWARSTVGVLLGASILMPFLAPPEDTWKPRRSSVAAPLIILLILTVCLSTLIRISREQQLHQKVNAQATQLKDKVENHLDNYFKSLYAAQKFYNTSKHKITRSEFKSVTKRLLNHKSMVGITWNPRVTGSEKDALEQSLRSEENLPDFEIKELTPQGSTQKSPARDTYFPVIYAEPFEKNELALGVDFLSSPSLSSALLTSIQTGKLTLSRPIQLPQGVLGIVAFLPVYESGSPSGVVALLIDIDNLITRDLGSFRGKVQKLRVLDTDPLQKELELFSYGSPEQPKDALNLQKINSLYEEEALTIGGRKWIMKIHLSLANLIPLQENNLFMAAWALLGLLGFLLLTFSGRKVLLNRLLLKNKQLETEIEYSNKISQDLIRSKEDLLMLSLTDPLTGLTNRRGLQIHAQIFYKLAKRHNKRMFLLFIDLDNMKYVNDTFGHKEGDILLIEVSKMLKDFFRETDIVARLGGDEFCVLLTANHGDESFVIKRLQMHIDHYNTDSARPLSLSIGWAIGDTETEFDLEKMISQADKMMYIHKQAKKKK